MSDKPIRFEESVAALWFDAQWWIDLGRNGVARGRAAERVREGFAIETLGRPTRDLLPEAFTGDKVRLLMRGRAYQAVVIVTDRNGSAALCVLTAQRDGTFTTSLVVGVPYLGDGTLYGWDTEAMPKPSQGESNDG